MAREYDLVIFDWDGTLMDSETKIVRCFQLAAEDANVSYPGDEAIRNIIGLGMAEAMAAIYPGENPETHSAVIEAYREHFLFRDQTEMPLFPGVPEGLSALIEDGYRLAVATGKARRGLDRVLEDSPLQHLFHSTRCADETRSKPHPLMIEEIISETGAAPERTIMVGDSVFDLEMARNAGVDSLAVSYGVQPCERLASYQPLGCMASFSDVCEWFR
ncbi:MAG: HAD-IA family hydrolase [Acidiferrobacterales bacterium]|nr:HAD-IA family hydrolase [Acidiferrobacterales bacterium]